MAMHSVHDSAFNSDELSNPKARQTQRCCKVNYKMRIFYSKGAFLVILWMTLLVSVLSSLSSLYYTLFEGLSVDHQRYYFFALTPVIPIIIICTPLIGWLADTRYGSYQVFKTGCLLTFLASVLACVCVVVLENSSRYSTLSQVLSIGVSPLLYLLGGIGIIACVLTAFKLGLDQMPEASPANITSFVAWFVCAIGAGWWVVEALNVIFLFCGYGSKDSEQLLSLCPAFCVAVVCCSLFLCGKKWLIIEPISPQSLKTIYQVLKFAAKHKAPLNRSALTYWEEDIPSRLDLGKAKYGGPFTTEQVEDVKTFLKMLALSLPISVSLLFLNQVNYFPVKFSGLNHKTSNLVYIFLYSQPFWMMMITFCTEFVIYPLFRNKLPSILTSIGIVAFVVLVVHTGYLLESIIDFFHPLYTTLWHWPSILCSILYGALTQLMLTKLLEFVCAQSPYNMRGLLTGILLFLCFSAYCIGNILQRNVICNHSYCPIVRNSAAVMSSLIGFVVYCVLARWYKLRARNEIYNAHHVVEEIYDRYLSYQ